MTERSESSAELLATVRAADAMPAAVQAAITRLLDVDTTVGIAAALDVLAGEPRLKPSRGLVVDPTDDVRRRWDCRVSATAALLASPAAERVAGELRDELADPDLSADVLALGCVLPLPVFR